MIAKLLDFAHKNKGKLGMAVAFLAAGLQALDYDDAATAVLYLGTLAGVGKLPNGPGYAPISKR